MTNRYPSVVVAVAVLSASGLMEFAEAQDANKAVEIEMLDRVGGGKLSFALPIDEFGQFFHDRELRPVFTSFAGVHRFALAPISPQDQVQVINFELPVTFRTRYEQEIAEVFDEIRQNCDPTPTQLEKLDAAAVGTLLHLTRRVRDLSNCRASANAPQELEKLAKEVQNVNELVRLGAMEPHTLFAKMLVSELTHTQLAELRWTYTLPLVRIMEDHDILVQSKQSQQLRKLVLVTSVSPFVLRNNYGQQYKNLMGLGEAVLSSIFSAEQMQRLSDRGRTDYRITLSR